MSITVSIVVAILMLQAGAQPPAIQGARISLVPKPQAVLNVTIENRYTSPLVEWQIRIGPPRQGQGIVTHTGYGSIQPGERQTVPVSLANPQGGATGTLILVAFANGFHQGTAQAVQGWRQVGEERAKDLSFWVRVFGMMPRVSEPDLRRYLADRSVERAGELAGDPSGVRAKLRDVLQRYPSGPEVWDGLDRLRSETQAALAAATRQPADGNSGGIVDAVSSVAISAQEQAKTTTYVAAIENLRGQAIEAVGFEEVDPVTNRVRGGQTSDFCLSEPLATERGHGRIQPKETRELPFGSSVNPNALPIVRFTFVVFDDLSFEGSAVARGELFRRREEKAADYAVAIAALAQVAVLPAREVETFVTAKRAERAKQLQSEGRRGDLHMFDEFLQEAKAAPERLVANAKFRGEILERQRQRLLRHKTAGAAKR